MILSEDQVIEIAKAPVDPVIGINARLQNDHKVHIEGTGFETVLRQIIGYENVEQFQQKKLLTKPFTRSLFKKIMNAQGRWKTARGTSKFYKFKKQSTDAQEKFTQDILSKVWRGDSIERMIKTFLPTIIYSDFNGFFVVERPAKEVIDGKTYISQEGMKRLATAKDNNLNPYITFKSADSVHSFSITGDRIQWIAFDFGKARRAGNDVLLIRVIDEVKDYVVEVNGDQSTISTEFPPLEHKAQRCPVVPATTILRKVTDDKTRTSPVDDIIKTLDYYLHLFAEHLVTEILHAHPNFFQTGQKCEATHHGAKCDEGVIKYNEGTEVVEVNCPSCKGMGRTISKDASTTLILPAFDQEGKAFSISNVMGYVTPPVEALVYQQNAIDWLENKIIEAATGVNNFKQREGLENTATGVLANIKPLEDIISEIIDVIEFVEKDLTDIIGKIVYKDSYVGCEIIRGRKLSLRDENALIEEITSSKEAGASYTHIKALNEELTYSRFARSEYDLQRAFILNEVEPLIGMTFSEVEDSNSIPKETKILKQNFNDYIQDFEEQKGDIVLFMPEATLSKKITEIKKELKVMATKDAGLIQPTTQP